MTKKNISLILAMLVLVIFAVGSVSAEENVTADIDVPTEEVGIDEVDVDDDPVDDAVESEEIEQTITEDIAVDDVIEQDENLDQVTPTVNSYNVNRSSNFTYYMSLADENNTVILNFTQDNYTGFSLTLKPYVQLWGNGITIDGAANQDIFTVTSTNNVVIKDFILNVGSNAAAIYGHHVTHSVFTNNTITGGKDGINIFQIHENLTITDNTIYGFTRDGISLVNFDTMDDTTWANFVASEVSGNKITGGQYGMFFGGNFKGVICSNNISGAGYGIEFAGKRAATNGRLNVTICNTNITDVSYGINLNHPSVEYFKLNQLYINSTIYDIITGDNFVKTGYIYVYNSTFDGNIGENFYYNVTSESGNDGFEL